MSESRFPKSSSNRLSISLFSFRLSINFPFRYNSCAFARPCLTLISDSKLLRHCSTKSEGSSLISILFCSISLHYYFFTIDSCHLKFSHTTLGVLPTLAQIDGITLQQGFDVLAHIVRVWLVGFGTNVEWGDYVW